MEGQKTFQLRSLDTSERKTHVEVFSGTEAHALEQYVKAGAIFSTFLSGPQGLFQGQLSQLMRKAQSVLHQLGDDDKERISALTRKLDALASHMPKNPLCRFVNIPEEIDSNEFLANVLTSGGVSERNATEAESTGKIPVIYCDNHKVDNMLRGKESIGHQGRGFAILVYDEESLRRVSSTEEHKYFLPSPYALAPVEGKTYSQALKAVLYFGIED